MFKGYRLIFYIFLPFIIKKKIWKKLNENCGLLKIHYSYSYHVIFFDYFTNNFVFN